MCNIGYQNLKVLRIVNIARVLFSNELKYFQLTIPGYQVTGLFLVFLLLSKLR